MIDNAIAMVLASFIADSLALGVHWIYDTGKIEKDFGQVDQLLKPAADSFHLTKDGGEFTHYGDQTFVLLESIASKKGFDPTDFSTRWNVLFESYHGYYDKATKSTMENLSQGKAPAEAGSSSTDLAGASRIAPLVYSFREDLGALVEAAKAQTRLTHNSATVIESADFFARVAFAVLNGAPPVSSMEEISNQTFKGSPVFKWVRQGIDSKDLDSVLAIGGFGQSCHTEDAFPGVIHLLARHENNLKEALIQAVMAGGDSAARGMIVGMILGAHLGEEGLPSDWISSLKKGKEILGLLDHLS